MNKVLRRNIKKYLKTLPSVSSLARDARRGIDKRYWYHNAYNKIKSIYGKDTDIFIGILSATSPRQTVKKNLDMAIEIYNRWVELGKPLDDNSLHEIALLGDLEARYHNIKRAIRGEPLSGNKVRAFKDNLSGNYESVTIDTWMINYIGVANSNMASSKGGYMAYSHRIRKTAKKLGWTPAEVQASIWSYCYSVTEKIEVKEVPEFDISGIV